MLDDPGTEIKVPLLTNRTVRNADGTPTAVETQYAWKPKLLDSVDVAGFTLGMPPNNGVVLSALLVTPLSDGEPSLTVAGRLTGLSLDFAKVLALELGEFKFRSEGGRKMDVTAKDVNLVFEGPLEFVNTIRDYVPAQGFSDPPAISVTSEGISAGYSLGIPSIGVGVVSIENIALAASLTLPFVEKPAGVRFALSERHSPFLVTVSLCGGGGFFALTVHAGAAPEIEAANEFGGNFSLDIGVASGGVHVMAGFYFKMDAKLVSLTGYLRCGGSLDVLGLVHISVEFYLGLTYQDNGKLWGEATLTVEVDVLCFSASVGLHLERQFAGAAGDPTFAQLVRPRDWEAYCGAFA
jgi:hypothetical protein